MVAALVSLHEGFGSTELDIGVACLGVGMIWVAYHQEAEFSCVKLLKHPS